MPSIPRPGAGDADPLCFLPGAEDGLAHLPEVIRDIVTDVSAASGASPACVAATALAIAAIALGPNARVSKPGYAAISPIFNVVVCHKAPRTLPWFDLLTAPFISRTLEMEAAVTNGGLANVKLQIEKYRKEYAAAAQAAGPESGLMSWLKSEIGRGDARLKPWVASSQITYREIVRLMPHSFDGGIVLIGLGNDPGDDFVRLKTEERSRIAGLLNRSWSGMPLSFNAKTYPGAISILWQTARPVSEIIGRPGFDPRFLSVPMLVFAEGSDSVRLPGLQHEAV